MEPWSTSSKVWLGIGSCVVFAAVVLLSGRDTRAQQGSPSIIGALPDTTPPSRIEPADVSAAAGTTQEPHAEEEAPTAEIPAPPMVVDVAGLSDQAMPREETTAEEDEQRGDVIRRLGASADPLAVPSVIHALRNDVDIRNRILAIDGLRRAALAGNTDRAITDALADAARSADEVIASQASQALAEIDRATQR